MKHLNAWVGAYGGIERPISTEVGSSFGYAKDMTAFVVEQRERCNYFRCQIVHDF